MLMRAGQFGAKCCLFIKFGKPKQDTRFDVPVFGMQTLYALNDAAIKNVALESGSVLLLNKEEVLKEAKHRLLELLGSYKTKFLHRFST